jgi:hypothetical protein
LGDWFAGIWPAWGEEPGSEVPRPLRGPSGIEAETVAAFIRQLGAAADLNVDVRPRSARGKR